MYMNKKYKEVEMECQKVCKQDRNDCRCKASWGEPERAVEYCWMGNSRYTLNNNSESVIAQCSV